MLFVSVFLQVCLTGEQSITRMRYLFGSKGCIFRNMGFKSPPASDLYLQLLSYTGRFINKRWERQNRDGRCNKKPIRYFSNMRNISIDWFPLEREKKNKILCRFSLMVVSIAVDGQFPPLINLDYEFSSGGGAQFL